MRQSIEKIKKSSPGKEDNINEIKKTRMLLNINYLFTKSFLDSFLDDCYIRT
jgi:hypothetical protein